MAVDQIPPELIRLRGSIDNLDTVLVHIMAERFKITQRVGRGILTMTPSVINSVLQTDMSEVIRIIVSNGMILYALTRKGRVRR